MNATGPCKFRLDDGESTPYRDGDVIQYFAVPQHFGAAIYALVVDAKPGDDGHQAHAVPVGRMRFPASQAAMKLEKK